MPEQVLRKLVLTGPLLGDLRFGSSEELQKGVKPLAAQWTI